MAASTTSFIDEYNQYLKKREEQYNILLRYKSQYKKYEQEYNKYLNYVLNFKKYEFYLIENEISTNCIVCEYLLNKIIELQQIQQTEIDNYLNEMIEERQNILAIIEKNKLDKH